LNGAHAAARGRKTEKHLWKTMTIVIESIEAGKAPSNRLPFPVHCMPLNIN
jgi:hypothetical protein